MHVPRKACGLFAVGLALALSSAAETLPDCGNTANATPPTLPTAPWQDHFVALTRIGNHWRGNMPNSDGDALSSPFWLDKGTKFPGGSPGLRETWYVMRDSVPGTNGPLYRLFNASLLNYRDSPDPTEGTNPLYTQDGAVGGNGIMGYPWTSTPANWQGLSPIRRYFNSTINDDLTWFLSAPPNTLTFAPLAAPAGTYVQTRTWWETGATPRLGFQRYGNLLDQCSVVEQGEDLTLDNRLENSKLLIKFNRILGNAVGEVFNKATGRDLVASPIGDMFQVAAFYGDPQFPQTGFGSLINPTQSGGTAHYNFSNTKRYAGSPVVFEAISQGAVSTHTTIVRPLNFHHDLYAGNDQWSPLLWRGEFRVATTLGCRIGSTVYDDVVKVRYEGRRDPGSAIPSAINLSQGSWFRTEQFGDCAVPAISPELSVLTYDAGGNLNPLPVTMDGVVQVVNKKKMVCFDPNNPATYQQVDPAAGTALIVEGAVVNGNKDVFGYVRFEPGPGMGYAANARTGFYPKMIVNTTKYIPIGTSPSWGQAVEVFWVFGTDYNTVKTRLQQLWLDRTPGSPTGEVNCDL